MKAVRNMVNSFAELKVCAETVELLKQMGIKKPMRDAPSISCLTM